MRSKEGRRDELRLWGGVLIFIGLTTGFFSCGASRGREADWSAQPDSLFLESLRVEAEDLVSNPESLRRLGVAEYRAGEVKAAEQTLLSARVIDPADEVSLYFLARSQDRIHSEEADSAYLSILALPDFDSSTRDWIENRMWNRAFDVAERNRKQSLSNLVGRDLLIPEFQIETSRRNRSGETPEANIVREYLPEIAALIRETALRRFVEIESTRRGVEVAEDLFLSDEAIVLGLVAVLTKEGSENSELTSPPETSGHAAPDRTASDHAVSDHAVSDRARQLLFATQADAVLQGVLSFDGAFLGVQWLWVQGTLATPVGTPTAAPLDSLDLLAGALALNLQERPTMRDVAWMNLLSSSPSDAVSDPDSTIVQQTAIQDPTLAQEYEIAGLSSLADLVSASGTGHNADRLLRIRARRAELERDLSLAEHTYRRMRLSDPTDLAAIQGIARVTNEARPPHAFENTCWEDLRPVPAEVDSSSPRVRSLLVDDVAASLSPSPLPDRSGEAVDPREDHLGADPVKEWIRESGRVFETGIPDFPDPPASGGTP